ncbi:MAG: GTA baseplate fiber-binding domain-containing protein, partial [Candidatus Thorarchaeota archaeon]
LVPDTVPGTSKEGSRSFKVVLTNEEALRREFLHLTQQYADQQRYKFSLFHHHLTIDPGDTGTITSDGVVHLVMVDETALGANFIYECSAVGFVVPTTAEADAILTEIHSLSTTLSAPTPDGFIEQSIGALNPTNLLMIDNVFLDDIVDQGNDTLEYQFVCERRSGGIEWDGAIITRSNNNVDFAQWHFYKSEFEGNIGAAVTALPRTDTPTVLDTVSTVQVQFNENVVLASVTDVELLEGKNAFLIGGELLNVGTVVDDGNGLWTLSRMLRGRRGTEHAVGIEYFQFLAPDHTTRERVAFLGNRADANKAMFRGQALSELNQEKFYRAESLGAAAGATLTTKFTNTGGVLKPFSPIPIAGSKSGSDWTGTITRRNRVGFEMRDLADIPLTDPENYEMDIYLNHAEPSPTGVGDTVVRTLTSTATANGSVINSDGTWTYDSLDMEADFGESPIVSPYPLYRLRVVAYQSNPDTVGRGWPGTAILEDPPDPGTDASFSSVSLLSAMESITPVDKSSNQLSMTDVGSSVTFTSGDWKDEVSMYGNGVLQFANDSNSYIRIPRASIGTLFDFGSGNFTVEAWVHQDFEHFGRIISLWSGPSDLEWAWGYSTGGTNRGAMTFQWTTDGSTPKTRSKTIPSDERLGLIHVAFVRNGTDGITYRDGIELTSGTETDFGSDTIFSGGSADLLIGAEGGFINRHRGKIDSIRVTKGVARYTGSTYTIPNNKFPTS